MQSSKKTFAYSAFSYDFKLLRVHTLTSRCIENAYFVPEVKHAQF